MRYSHCEKKESYLCCFLMNGQGEVAYEINKRQEQYTNIRVLHDIDTKDDNDIDHLAIKVAQKGTVMAQEEEIHSDIHKNTREVVTIN